MVPPQMRSCLSWQDHWWGFPWRWSFQWWMERDGLTFHLQNRNITLKGMSQHQHWQKMESNSPVVCVVWSAGGVRSFSDEVISTLTGTVVSSPTDVVIFGVTVEAVDKTGLSETSRKKKTKPCSEQVSLEPLLKTEINWQILMWSMDCAVWHVTEHIHHRLCSRQMQAPCCTLHRTTARRCPDESQCSSASHRSYPAGRASSCGRWSHFDLTIPASCTEEMIWENWSHWKHLSKRRAS